MSASEPPRAIRTQIDTLRGGRLSSPCDGSPTEETPGDQKGTRCGPAGDQSRGCPRNCKRRARCQRHHWETGKVGNRRRPASQETCHRKRDCGAGRPTENHPNPHHATLLRVNEVRGASTMRKFLGTILSDDAGNLRRRVLGLYALLLGANLAAWAWALLALRNHPVLLGT